MTKSQIAILEEIATKTTAKAYKDHVALKVAKHLHENALRFPGESNNQEAHVTATFIGMRFAERRAARSARAEARAELAVMEAQALARRDRLTARAA